MSKPILSFGLPRVQKFTTEHSTEWPSKSNMPNAATSRTMSTTSSSNTETLSDTTPAPTSVQAQIPEDQVSPLHVVSAASAGLDQRKTQHEPYMKPSYHFNAENIVTLIVGPDQQKMTVHTEYITRTSEFFATALKSEWAESHTRTIELHEETPELLAHYLDWVYRSELPTRTCTLFDESAKSAAKTLLSQLYVLGERRLDSKFRNAIIAEIIRLRPVVHRAPLFGCHACGGSNQADPANIIYQGTSSGSPARRLMVDLSLRFGCPAHPRANLDNAFLSDLTHAFFVALQSPKGVEGQRGTEPKAQDYHV